MNRKDLQALRLVGPTWQNPVTDTPFYVLCRKRINFRLHFQNSGDKNTQPAKKLQCLMCDDVKLVGVTPLDLHKHLVEKHFRERMLALIPCTGNSPEGKPKFSCPFSGCSYEHHYKWIIAKHYGVKHRVAKQFYEEVIGLIPCMTAEEPLPHPEQLTVVKHDNKYDLKTEILHGMVPPPQHHPQQQQHAMPYHPHQYVQQQQPQIHMVPPQQMPHHMPYQQQHLQQPHHPAHHMQQHHSLMSPPHQIQHHKQPFHRPQLMPLPSHPQIHQQMHPQQIPSNHMQSILDSNHPQQSFQQQNLIQVVQNQQPLQEQVQQPQQVQQSQQEQLQVQQQPLEQVQNQQQPPMQIQKVSCATN